KNVPDTLARTMFAAGWGISERARGVRDMFLEGAQGGNPAVQCQKMSPTPWQVPCLRQAGASVSARGGVRDMFLEDAKGGNRAVQCQKMSPTPRQGATPGQGAGLKRVLQLALCGARGVLNTCPHRRDRHCPIRSIPRRCPRPGAP